MTQMESPKRKLQKKNDYQRHKLFRKIKRRRKAQAEAEQQIAEKQLRKKLKLPKFGDGKEKVNLDNAHFDKDGNLVDNTTGTKYTATTNDVIITPNTKYFYDPYVGAKNYYNTEDLPIVGPASYWTRMASSHILGNDESKAGVRESIRNRALRSVTPTGYSWMHSLQQLYKGEDSQFFTDVNDPDFLEKAKYDAAKFAKKIYNNKMYKGFENSSYQQIYDKVMQRYKDDLDFKKQRYEFFETYLGKNLNNKILQQTSDRPKKSNFSGRFFKLNDKQFDIKNEEAFRYLLTNNKKNVVVHNANLGDYTVSLGRDKNGDYYSAYDEWDLTPFGKPDGNDQTFGIGIPFAVYNKYYYNPSDYVQNKFNRVYKLREDLKPVNGQYHSILGE